MAWRRDGCGCEVVTGVSSSVFLSGRAERILKSSSLRLACTRSWAALWAAAATAAWWSGKVHLLGCTSATVRTLVIGGGNEGSCLTP